MITDVISTKIEELKDNLEEAIRVLAPKFGISSETLGKFDKPSFEIRENVYIAGYDSDSNRFLFDADFVEDSEALGEEASHYLHDRINLDIREFLLKRHLANKQTLKVMYRKAIKYAILCETVGLYGRLVYLNEICGKPPNTKLFFDTRKPRPYGPNDMELALHVKGYKRGAMLFALYGDSLLQEVARMNIDHAFTVLPRLAPITLFEKFTAAFGGT